MGVSVMSPVFPRRIGNETQRGSAASPRPHRQYVLELALKCRTVTSVLCLIYHRVSFPGLRHKLPQIGRYTTAAGIYFFMALSWFWSLEVRHQGVGGSWFLSGGIEGDPVPCPSPGFCWRAVLGAPWLPDVSPDSASIVTLCSSPCVSVFL